MSPALTAGARMLRQQILQTPQQLAEGIRLTPQRKLPRPPPPTQIVFAGMGGSALYADLLLDHINQELGIPSQVHRSYGLPTGLDRKTLVIVSSYSGNTEETLSALKTALHHNYSVLVLAHGGELLRIAKNKRLPYIAIPACAQPRYSVNYMFSAVHHVLSRPGWVHPCVGELTALAQWLKHQNLDSYGAKLAKRLKGAIPLVYAPPEYASIARTAKIKINENAKVPAFYNVLPELNHNEMVGFTRPLAKFHALFLTDSKQSSPMRARIKATTEAINQTGVPSTIINLKGRTLLERTFYANLLFDWTSYHLALGYGIDPMPVDMVEQFKARLKRI